MTMRRTATASNKPEWLLIDDELIGIQLGADFTAEHERGIENINKALDIIGNEKGERTKIFGVDRYKIKPKPDNFFFREQRSSPETVMLFFDSAPFQFWNDDPNKISMKNLCTRYEIDLAKAFGEHEEQTLACAWDDASFGIHVKGKRQVKYLKKLYLAFLNGDAVVFLGEPPLPAFSRPSLNLMILSAIPEEGKQYMIEKHKEQWELAKYAEKTGIEKKLAKAGKKWFALSPRKGKMKTRAIRKTEGRTTFEDVSPSKFDIMFFLNPMNQQEYNSGWFTVEELREWANNKGPVMKVNIANSC